MILGKKQISDKYIRLRVRDAKYQDSGVCDTKEILDDVQVGDIRWFSECVCINTPNWRRALKPGKGLLVGKVDELNMENLGEATDLTDHITQPF